MNEYWASENIPSDSFCHPVECSPKENPFQVHYIRSLPVPSGDSPLLYDIGKTYIATQGMPDDGNIVGDLWVTYEIELMKPQIQSNVSTSVSQGLAEALGSITAGTSPLGSSLAAVEGSIPFTMQNRTITFPTGLVGKFLIVARIAGSPTFSAFDWSGTVGYTNCVATGVDTSGASYTRTVMAAGAGATVNSGYIVVGVELTDPSATATVVVPGAAWTGTAGTCRVTISEL